MMQVKLLAPDAVAPTRGSGCAAGLDLYSYDTAYIKPGERQLIGTGIGMAIPYGHAALIWPRSGLSVKHGIGVLAGVVDSDYRGEIKVALLNTGNEPLQIQPCDRIAQMVIQRVEMWDPVIVSDLPNSDRGGNGFGSTGR